MPKSRHRDLTREQRRRVGETIRAARGDVTQAELGDRIGEAQTTLSRWENGDVDIDLSQANRIERALDLPAGWIALRAGLIDVEALVEDDPRGVIRIGYYDSYGEAATDVAAAATLGLGVRVTNRFVPNDTGSTSPSGGPWFCMASRRSRRNYESPGQSTFSARRASPAWYFCSSCTRTSVRRQRLFDAPTAGTPAELGASCVQALANGTWPRDLFTVTDCAAWAATLAECGECSPTELLSLVLSELALVGDHTDHTIKRMGQEMAFLVKHLKHAGICDVREVNTMSIVDFIEGPVRSGRSWADPSLSTRYLRRSAARLYFKTARRLGHLEGDPVEALLLPPRSPATTRPLTDEEIIECRQASRRTLVETRLPASLALAEATGCPSERAATRLQDVDTENARVWLHDGGRNRVARWGSLTEWGVRVLAARIDAVGRDANPDTLLVYAGRKGGPSAESSASSALYDVLTLAGIAGEPGVKPSSVTAWAGMKVFEATGHRIEAVALALGLKKLDSAAKAIGWDWRGEK